MEISRTAMTFATGEYHKVYLYLDVPNELAYPYAVPQKLKGNIATFNLHREKPEGGAIKLMLVPGVKTANRYTAAFSEGKYWGVRFEHRLSLEPVEIVSIVDVGDELELQVRLTDDHMSSIKELHPSEAPRVQEEPKAEKIAETVSEEASKGKVIWDYDAPQEEHKRQTSAKTPVNDDRTVMKADVVRNLLEIMECNDLKALRIPNSNITIEA